MRTFAIAVLVSIALVVGGVMSGVLSARAFADEGAPPRPCKNLLAACKAAGYQRHADGKDLRKDCMGPLLHGQAVPGVSVDPNDVQACLAHHHDKHPQP